MTIRSYDEDRDLKAIERIWFECGWLENSRQAAYLKDFLAAGHCLTATIDDVAECAVIGVADALKGQLPLGMVVLKSGVERTESELVPELVALVRKRIGPVAAFKQACIVARLPKTRSGKVLRGTMRKIADAEPWRTPPTIDDPAILDEIRVALERLGYGRKEADS